MIRHFQEQLGKTGWKLDTISRSKASLMTFPNASRAATIEVSPSGGFGGNSAFTVVVSPQLTGNAPPQARPPAK